jgi:hypothetical protein
MSRRGFWSNIFLIVGFMAMLVGAIDPLEGSVIILPGSGLVALGAFLGKSRYRMLLLWSFILIIIGVGAMFGLSMLGGIGGKSGHSMWWGLSILPYPFGWIIGIVGIILRLVESSKSHKQKESPAVIE